MNKLYHSILIAFFVVLLILSIVYFKERVYYYDSAFQFFKIIYSNTFNIEANRYSTFITQIPALLALKLGWSLKSISIIFSSTFIGVYFLVFLIIQYGFKNEFVSLAIAMSFAMSTSLGFFHTVTETHQAIVYSLLFVGWLYFPGTKPFSIIRKPLNIIISLLIIILTFFSHPVAFFLLLYILGFYLVDTNSWKKFDSYLYVFLIFLGLVLKLIFTKSDSYEGHLFSQPILFGELVSRFWTLFSFKFFINRILNIYFFTVLTGLIVTVNYFYLKQWTKLGYFLLTSGAFFLVTLVIYHEGNAEIAMERIFLPLNVFVSIPFCKDFVFQKKQMNSLILVYISLLFLFGIGFIVNGANRYKKRTHYLEILIKKANDQNGSKFIMYREQLNMDIVEVPWAISTETLLLSSIEKKKSITIYFVENKNDINNIDIKNTNVMLVTSFWLYWNAEELNKNYFILKPEPYKLMSGNLK